MNRSFGTRRKFDLIEIMQKARFMIASTHKHIQVLLILVFLVELKPVHIKAVTNVTNFFSRKLEKTLFFSYIGS